MYACMYVCIYIYIYIYRERERERCVLVEFKFIVSLLGCRYRAFTPEDYVPIFREAGHESRSNAAIIMIMQIILMLIMIITIMMIINSKY